MYRARIPCRRRRRRRRRRSGRTGTEYSGLQRVGSNGGKSAFCGIVSHQSPKHAIPPSGALVPSNRPIRRPRTHRATGRTARGSKREPRQHRNGGKTVPPLAFWNTDISSKPQNTANQGHRLPPVDQYRGRHRSILLSHSRCRHRQYRRSARVGGPRTTVDRFCRRPRKCCRPMPLTKWLWNGSLVPTEGPHGLEIQSSAAWAESSGGIPRGDGPNSKHLALTAFAHTESSLQGYPLEQYRLLCCLLDQDGGNGASAVDRIPWLHRFL